MKPKVFFEAYFRRFQLHVEHRVKLHVPTPESFPIPLKDIDFTRTFDSTLDVMPEKRVEDYWNVDGERELSDAWTRLHEIHCIERDAI